MQLSKTFQTILVFAAAAYSLPLDIVERAPATTHISDLLRRTEFETSLLQLRNFEAPDREDPREKVKRWLAGVQVRDVEPGTSVAVSGSPASDVANTVADEHRRNTDDDTDAASDADFSSSNCSDSSASDASSDTSCDTSSNTSSNTSSSISIGSIDCDSEIESAANDLASAARKIAIAESNLLSNSTADPGQIVNATSGAPEGAASGVASTIGGTSSAVNSTGNSTVGNAGNNMTSVMSALEEIVKTALKNIADDGNSPESSLPNVGETKQPYSLVQRAWLESVDDTGSSA